MNGEGPRGDGVVFDGLNVNGKWVKAVYFHLPTEPNGFLSNWYPAAFELDGLRFSSAEQYIMYRKCALMDDGESAARVLASGDPKEQQKIGKKAGPYNALLWEGTRQALSVRCLTAKFTQDERLRELLLLTGDAYLVECANTDRIWACGRGLGREERRDMALWDGANMLGFTLMEVRGSIREN